MTKISSAEFQRNLGLYQDKALSEPVTITKNGRERLVLLSVNEYDRLKRRDQSVFRTSELPDEWIPDAVRLPELVSGLVIRYSYLRSSELKDPPFARSLRPSKPTRTAKRGSLSFRSPTACRPMLPASKFQKK
jgi:prevent-host-death family protein